MGGKKNNLCEVRFDPQEVRLNIKNSEKLEYTENWNFEIL